MKNVILIIFAILLTGCVAERQDGPALDAKELLKCPEIVEAAAKNLEQFKIDPLLVQTWKKSVLSKKAQPCSVCQKLNAAAYVLNDENDIYKPAMLEFIKNVEQEDPNKVPTQSKPYISSTTIDEKTMAKTALARQYLNAIDDLQYFLSAELKMPVLNARNFAMDNYFIPLLQEEEKVLDSNQTLTEVAEPNSL
ncbi:MAG: hypothetical protein JXA96_09695 [Sedimentisphaerales bacterium]|nr:hypothetical protein [Sedimentisphaerales bacterium]